MRDLHAVQLTFHDPAHDWVMIHVTDAGLKALASAWVLSRTPNAEVSPCVVVGERGGVNDPSDTPAMGLDLRAFRAWDVRPTDT